MRIESKRKTEIAATSNISEASSRSGGATFCGFLTSVILFASSPDNNESLSTTKWHVYESLSRRSMIYMAVFLGAIFTTAISVFTFMPIGTINATETVTPSETIDNTPAVGVSLSDIDFGGISTDSSGTVKTVSNTATINSSIYGYELYISSSDDTNSLVRSGTAGTSASEIIPATSTADTTAPSVLSNDTWGFAVQRRNTTTGSGSEDVVANAAFDSSYPTGDSSSANSKFAAIPTLGNKVLIAERDSSATNVPTNIYYGIRVTTDKPSGLYQGSVTYTAIGKAPTTHTVTIKTAPGISRVTIGETECTSTEGCDVTLTYGYSYSLSATTESGYTFNEWGLSNSIGAFTDDGINTSTTSNSATTTFIAGKGGTIIIPSTTANTYYLNLDNQSANTAGSTVVYYRYNIATFYTDSNFSTTTTKIAIPSRTGYTFGGYYTGTNGDGTQYIAADGSFTNNPQNLMGNPTTLYAKWTINNYNITFLDGAINTGYEGTTQFLAAGAAVPVVDSSILNLSTNTNYTVSFDYVGSEASNEFVVDLIPDGLPQILPIATTTVQHYDWTLSSTSSNMGSSYLRFFDDIDRTSSSGSITISNIMLSRPNIQSKAYGSTLGTLPTPSKVGYVFDGWWTAPSGGTQINVSTKVQGNATYYAHWHSLRPFIQDFTNAMCQAQASAGNITVMDRRDVNEYTVRYINGNCWMTSNLRITGLITKTNSNFSSGEIRNISEGDLTAGSSYVQTRTHTGTDSNGNPTVWYNYAAATVGTIVGDSNFAIATQDICPKNWRLPTGGFTASSSEQQALTDAIGSSPSAFSPVTGGYYFDGSLIDTEHGRWWSATAYSDRGRYSLYYDGSNLGTSNGFYWHDGFYVRCIRSS